MGRNHSISTLPVELHERVNQCIRQHRYMNLDAILEDIHQMGIDQISRSALGRYIPKLRAKDELKAAPNENTVVTIVDRSSGEVRVIKTMASPASIATLIAKFSGTTNVS